MIKACMAPLRCYGRRMGRRSRFPLRKIPGRWMLFDSVSISFEMCLCLRQLFQFLYLYANAKEEKNPKDLFLILINTNGFRGSKTEVFIFV